MSLSPRRKKPSSNPKKLDLPKRHRGLGWFVIIGLLALYAASLIDPSTRASKVVEYSEIKTAVRAGDVKEVWIGTGYVEALKTDGKRLLAHAVDDNTLVPLLEEKQVKYGSKAESGWLRELFFSWILPFGLMFFLWQVVMGRMARQGPPGLMAFGKSRAKLVADEKNKTTFADVAGCDEAKEELSEIVAFLKNPDKFTAIGGRIPKGVLLAGPPGTGKTLLARAVAGEAGVNFFQLSGSDFVEMFVGVGAARVRDLFEQAQKSAPCIVFIDELDAIAKSRGMGVMQTNDEREQTLNQILVEMDGFDNHTGIILMAATNRPEVLDPAILRPGRFDRQIMVGRPDRAGREAILRVHAQKVKTEAEIPWDVVAARTPGFSGADLANVVNEAALLAVRRGRSRVDMSCLEEAIDRVLAGLARKSRVLSEPVRRIIAVHEVGHALVARFTKGADPVHKISIIPRGSGALGFTLQLPNEDPALMTRDQLLGMVRVLLGGRAAEKLVNNDVTSGAQDDLRRASDIIRRMIVEFGMGESLGLVSYASDPSSFGGNPFLRQEHPEPSEALQSRIDAEVRHLLDQQFDAATDILRTQRVKLDQIVTRLLEKETIEAGEFEALSTEALT